MNQIPPSSSTPKAYTCSQCRNPAHGKWEDFGIGGYEFWGQRGTDKDEAFVSDCCDADVLDPTTLEVMDGGPNL